MQIVQNMPEETSEGMSITELLHILKVRIGWIIATFVLVVAAGVAYLQYVTPMYESEVTILVESLQKSSDIESMLTGQGTTKIATEVELALSRSNINDALAKLDLSSYRSADGEPYTDPQVLGDVKERTSVTTVKDTNLVRITVTDQNPLFARDFANALAESYNELLGSIARNSKTIQRQFIESQIPINEQQLQHAAYALSQFREESNFIQLSDKSKLLSQKIAYFQLRREPLALQLEEAITLSEYYASILSSYAIPGVSYDQVLEDVDVSQLLASYKDRTRELVLYEAIREGVPDDTERLFVLESALSQITKSLVDRISLLVAPRGLSNDPFILLSAQELAKATHQRAITEAQIEVLSSIENSYATQLAQLPALERQLLDLEREVQVYETLHMRLLELLEEVKIAEAATSGSVTVVDAAIAQDIPVSPNKTLILAVAVLLGAALGVLLALLIETLDVTIKDEGTLRKLAGPTRPLLGWVPLMNYDESLDIPSLVVYNDPLSFESERYKLIANNVSLGTLRKTQRVFSITSPGMGEGKTSVTANVATSMAMNGHKVLLIDGDLRLPQLESFFNLKKSASGLVEVITSGINVEEVIVQPLADVPTLHLLPPGMLPPLPSAIFNSDEYVALLDHLLGIYDYIIIDTPPLVFASELMAIAKHVDGVVVNVRAGVSTKGGMRELLDNLDLAGVRVLGVIFNGVIESKMGGHYSSGRYYTYQGTSYTKRYYNVQDKEKRKNTQTVKVRGGYRANFRRDLKKRERSRNLGTLTPIHPFVEKRDPFASLDGKQKKAPRLHAYQENMDPLDAIEQDPHASGKQP